MQDIDELIEDDNFMGKLEIVLFIVVITGLFLNIPYTIEQRNACKKAYKECNSPPNISEMINDSTIDQTNVSPNHPSSTSQVGDQVNSSYH